MSAPLFSIITPTYKRPELLARAIRSVRAQTCQSWEMCIVDNHSPDDTLELIAQFHDPRLRVAQIHNEGIIARSRNRALSMASGTYLAFLDSDDWWRADKLEIARQQMEAGADLFYHDLEIVPESKRWFRAPTLGTGPLAAPVFENLKRHGNRIPNSSVVLRRTLATQVGSLSEDPDLAAAEDYDYWLRCARQTDAFVFSSQRLGSYWLAGNSMSTAARTLRWAEALRARYGQDAFPWMTYTLARAHYAQGEYKEVLAHLDQVNRIDVGVPRLLRAKALKALTAFKTFRTH